jgi:N-acetylglucosamine kinase-like BadF-type ATPase
MILIADGGSTKTEWSIMSDDEDQRINTQGISPYFHSVHQILEILKGELLPFIGHQKNISEIYYYGTGCTGPATINIVSQALTDLFPSAKIEVTYDLVAAAHALCGYEKGIACILGTGSNSGYYNGREIEKNIPGLGYILGDEGSGAYLGKILTCKYLYRKLEPKLKEKFESTFAVSEDTILERIYSGKLVNRYLASFSMFLSDNREHPQVQDILLCGLGDFFSLHIAEYDESHTVPVHFTGSIAWAYRDILLQLCEDHGFYAGKIIKGPMDGLVEYYKIKK